jgi:hypothetical protein
MNSFDYKFFEKYTPEWQEIQHIVHQHWINIIWKVFFWMFLFVLIPVFIYYFSYRAKDLIPFMYFEIYLFIVYIKIIYDIFDWYNDVWIITDSWVVDLDWSLFKTNMSTIDFDNMEWMEVEQNSFVDKILKKWDLIIHKIWDDSFVLPDCLSPYDALNKVEHIKHHHYEEEDNPETDRFDMVMDTLWGVVENYLKREFPVDDADVRKKENIDEYKKSSNSIDLR